MLVSRGLASKWPSVYTHSLGDLVHPQSCTHVLGIQHLTTYLQEGLVWPPKEGSELRGITPDGDV